MYLPSDDYRKVQEKVSPWIRLKKNGQGYELDEKAPDNIKELFEQFEKINREICDRLSVLD